MTRYFNFDEISINLKYAKDFSICHLKRPISPNGSDDQKHQIRDEVFRILMFFSKSKIPGLCEKALISLG